MRAVVFDQFGPPEVIHATDLPVPTPGPGEVVVEVAAATLNPTDLMMRSGQQAKLMTDLRPPYIAGMEFAGHVRKRSPDSSRLEVGQSVIGIVNPRRPKGGAHCEFVCVPEASVVSAPVGVDLVEAATIPMNGLTARMALDALSLQPGATLLVTGGAGALGGYVIQLARYAGLSVIADASERDRGLLMQLGATAVVPRGEDMGRTVRSMYAAGVDAAVDCALLGDAAAALVRDGGSLVSVRSSQKYGTPRVNVKYIGVLQQVLDTDALTWVAARAQEHVLTPRVAQTFAFSDAAQAHRLLEQGGLRGRIVLVP